MLAKHLFDSTTWSTNRTMLGGGQPQQQSNHNRDIWSFISIPIHIEEVIV